MSTGIFVTKRDGRREAVDTNKITVRLQSLCTGPLTTKNIDIHNVCRRVIGGIVDGVSTSALDDLAASTCAELGAHHIDYLTLAARITISNLHKMTEESFVGVADKLYNHNVVTYTGGVPKTSHKPLISEQYYRLCQKHGERLQAAFDFTRDFQYSFFSIRTLMNKYLAHIDRVIVERPQHLLMRVALSIHEDDIDAVLESYHSLSALEFTHATPTLFNAGMKCQQFASCFLMQMKEDSIDGIFDTLKDCAIVSKYAGGIGLSVNKIRASGSLITGTNGISNGIAPMLQVYNATMNYVDQGGGKRKGSCAVYMSPWHADIESFLRQKRPTSDAGGGKSLDLFYALWVSDLFMKRVKANGDWCLFCPSKVPDLQDAVGADFEALYTAYEAVEGLASKRLKAQDLWRQIIVSQLETGTPYMLYKDACNLKSNHKHLGTIQSSNLCTEIVQYTSKDEVAVCNLASVSLSVCVNQDTQTFDFEKLERITRIVTRNLNKIIDKSFYALPAAKRSNLLHRPMGIGVQGLADAFMMLRMPFDSEEAAALNRDIFETMYYASVSESCKLAEHQGTYPSYDGSPVSCGLLQFDMWGVKPSDRYNWAALKADIARHGLRNSLLLSIMPTASTAQIMGNYECIEAPTTNLYKRRVLAGEYIVMNKYLFHDLSARGLWDKDMRIQLIEAKGSIQHIARIPDDLKALYKTVYEIDQRAVVNLAVGRGPFICQSQSMNLHLEGDAIASRLSRLLMYGWERGLKTGMYYLRSRAGIDATRFSVDVERVDKLRAQSSDTGREAELRKRIPTMQESACEMCSA